MSSMRDIEACKICKGLTTIHYYFYSGEGFSQCHRCGHYIERSFKKDHNNNPILNDQRTYSWDETVLPGYGVYGYIDKRGTYQINYLHEPLNQNLLLELKEVLNPTYIAVWEQDFQTVVLGEKEDIPDFSRKSFLEVSSLFK